jgi:ketosteroid isomerase-like protein
MERSKEMEQMIAALRAAYAAFNRGDIDAALAPMDASIEWSEPAEFPGGGAYHGREGVRRYLTQSRAGWAEGSSEPERFITAGNRVIVFVHARIRPQGSNEWSDVRLADVYTVRDGKAVQMRAFADRQEALHWVGAGESNP